MITGKKQGNSKKHLLPTAECNTIYCKLPRGDFLLWSYPLSAYLFSKSRKISMAKKTFETALSRLEQITEELESGDLSLEDSLKKFDEGVKLADYCNARLSEARTKVEMLLEKDGRLQSEPFEEAGDES